MYTNGSNAVLNDVSAAVTSHSMDILRPVQLNGKYTIVSKYNHIAEDKFFSDGVEFTVDKQTGKVSETGEHEPPSADASKLQKMLDSYITDHYEADTTVGKVFDTDNGFAALITGRKLSPQNYFNGAWIASYEIGQHGSVKGSIKVDVHYFEDGNVRLKSTTPVDVSGGDLLDAIKEIAKAESEYEVALNRALVNINEHEFKALRRQLPVTRSYMDWGQAATYRLGRDLENRD